MREVTTAAELRAALDEARQAGQIVGFVPTMGYLHAGHASLMEKASDECDVVLASIFVNPLQFAPTEDLDAYPRDLERDRATTAAAGVSLLFVPSSAEMYPESMATTVSVAGVSERFEGASRPSHFAGVATVVAKLFNLSGPCRAYFGEKDFQQIAVIRRMVRDLSIPVEIVACPTVREDDALAMSSRNAYLNPDQRAAAPVLHQALVAGATLIQSGTGDAERVRAAMHEVVASEPLAEVDYLEVADPVALEPVGPLRPYSGRAVRLLGAVRIGSTRLIDNVGAIVPPETTP
jgi:pantoate--beta-alanine ligase